MEEVNKNHLPGAASKGASERRNGGPEGPRPSCQALDPCSHSFGVKHLNRCDAEETVHERG